MKNVQIMPLCIICYGYSYGIFHICHFFTRAKFLEDKIYTKKKRVNYDKIHRKLPIFCVTSEKNYTGQKKIILQKFCSCKKMTNIRYAKMVPIRTDHGKKRTKLFLKKPTGLMTLILLTPIFFKIELKFVCSFSNSFTLQTSEPDRRRC